MHSMLAAFRGWFSKPFAEERVTVVALVSSARDRKVLSQLAAEHAWVVYFARNCGEAWDLLVRHRAPLFLCDRELPGLEWRDVIRMMVSSPHPVYAILVSRVADDYLWNEVVRRGGQDLLASPLREYDVLRAIRLAWSYWNSSMKTPAVTR